MSAVALALITNMNRKILDAIVEIRNQKKRPCRDSIFDVVGKGISCSSEEFDVVFDAMESKGLIENRGTAKCESYYNMANFFGALKQSISEELAMERQDPGKDIVDFKKFMHTEMVVLKAEVEKMRTKTQDIEEKQKKSGANLRDELIHNSYTLPSHIDPERIISEQQREIEFLRDEILSLNEIIKISLRNQTQNQAMNQMEHDVIKNSKASDARWQEIPSREREPSFKMQKQPQRSSHENQILGQTPLHNRFSILETMHAEETMSDTDIINEEDNASNNRRSLEGTQQNKQKKKKATTMIIGDSIVTFVDGKQMHRSLQRSQNVLVKSFPGATTSHMKHHIVPCMERKPDHVVLHVGCNDIRSKDAPSAIASRIVELASDVQRENTTVTVSTLIPRNDSNELNEKTEAVNSELKQMCSQRKISIIEHSNLDRNIHVNRNVHLSRAGTSAFAGNITRYLKN